MKIAIGIACSDFVRTRTVGMLVALFKARPDSRLIMKISPYVHDNREQIVADFLKTDCTHLFFVDSDMLFKPDALDKLLAHDKDIIGAQYYRRNEEKDKDPVVPTRYDMPGSSYPNRIFRNYAVGTGCMLIKREALEKIPRPWFGLGTNERWLGEDVFFCEKAIENGVEVWMDASLTVGHIGEKIY